MIIFRQNNYSIQSGKPDKGGSLWREIGNKAKLGLIGGGLLGGTLGAVYGGMVDGLKGAGIAGGVGIAVGGGIFTIASCLSALGADRRRAVASRMTMNDVLDQMYQDQRELDAAAGTPLGTTLARYVVEDGNPDKFMVTFAFEDGKGIIYLNKPNNPCLECINETLEDMVKYERKADYVSQPVDNGYIVSVILPDIHAFGQIIGCVISELRIQVCCLTSKSLNKYRK